MGNMGSISIRGRESFCTPPPPDQLQGQHSLLSKGYWGFFEVNDWLQAGQPGFKSSILSGAGNFSLLHCIHTGYGAHPASHPVGTQESFPSSKVARA